MQSSVQDAITKYLRLDGLVSMHFLTVPKAGNSPQVASMSGSGEGSTLDLQMANFWLCTHGFPGVSHGERSLSYSPYSHQSYGMRVVFPSFHTRKKNLIFSLNCNYLLETYLQIQSH